MRPPVAVAARSESLLVRLDPTHPRRWDRVRQGGKPVFLLAYGVLGLGVPLALLAHLALLATRGDWDLVVSTRSAIELTFTLLVVAPAAGVVLGQVLWTRGERRSERATPAALDAYPAATAEAERAAAGGVVEADAEQRRLTALKAHLDRLAETAPRRLVWRVILMTALGYGYVLLVAALLVAGTLWLGRYHGTFARLAGQGAWMLGWFGLFLISALVVRMQAPKGQRITRAGSPALFDAIDAICRRIDAPAPDVVLLDGQLNAFVSETPRFGIFGVPRRYLVVGLPLLEALPADECCAILAHEMAHLSRRHLRRLAWVVRLSATWERIAAGLEGGRHWGRALFLPFFRWYAPRFELHAQAVARRDEHESDALAAECVGPATAARALLRLHVVQRFLARSLLPAVCRESADRAEPPAGAFEWLAEALRRGAPQDDLARWTRSALAERTLDDHSHPSLADRLAAVACGAPRAASDDEPTVQHYVGQLAVSAGDASGAEQLLGRSRLPKLRAQVGAAWQTALLEAWRRWHADARIWRAADRGEDGAAPASTAFDASWARARWAADCEPSSMAVPLVRAVLRERPSHVEATVLLGRLLADEDDAGACAEGVELLETVLRRDSGVALAACEALEAHYARRGRTDDVARVRTRARRLREAALRTLAERRELRADDRIAPYPLPAPSLATLRKLCTAQRDIASVYLVRKRTDYLVEQPCVVLAVACHVPWYKPATGRTTVAACAALLGRVPLPEVADLLVLPLEPRSRLHRRLRAMPGAELYRRD